MPTTDYSARPYTASFVLLRKDDKIAFLLRQNTGWMNGFYTLPSGKVDEGESFSAAAIREAKEEVGVTIAPQNLKHTLTGFSYERESDRSLWVHIFFEATDWEGEPYNAEPHVHAEIAWLDLSTLPENVVPSVRYYLEQITAGNHYAEYGWGE